jgi:hypothetical protein
MTARLPWVNLWKHQHEFKNCPPSKTVTVRGANQMIRRSNQIDETNQR